MLAPLMLPDWQFELLEHRLEFLRVSGKLVSAGLNFMFATVLLVLL
jgi:hypothetical protein